MVYNYLKRFIVSWLSTNTFVGIACIWLAFFCNSIASAQSVSNEGTEFFAVFPKHVPSPQNGVDRLAEYYLFITARQNSKVIVTAGNYNSGVLNITANQVLPVPIPRAESYLDNAGMYSNRAIRVKVQEGEPRVIVFGHIFAGARSAASLILPVEAMGQQYFSMNYESSFNQPGGDNFINVVATEPDTKVLLKRNGVVFQTINLVNVGDVYQYLTKDDPTGTEIIADPAASPCNRFAVFSGSTNALIAPNNCSTTSSDPLYQQNYPVESWGTSYGFVPFSSQSASGAPARTAGSLFRILAKDNGTTVRMNGTVLATLNAGQFYQSAASNVAGIITADKPVSVAQYALSQTCSGANGLSDPDMVILNPIEYNIKNITVYSATDEAITEQYLNVFIKTSAAASFRINGSAPPAPFTALSSQPEYSYVKINLNGFGTNNFTLSAAEGFNAIAYGFGAFESYAYSAGTNLASNQTLNAVRTTSQEELANACTREDFRFKLVLPAQASKLTWIFDPSEPPLPENNPTATPVIRNGKTFYQYFYPRTRIFDTPGSRTIKVIAEYLSSNECYKEEEEIDFIFDVYDPPAAQFTYSNTCALETVSFLDASTSTTTGKPVNAWFWDFGEGTTSQLQNPTHKFPTSGTFKVKLFVDNGTGCLSDVEEQNIIIRPLPLSSFVVSEVSCTDNSVSFSDESAITEGSITGWSWDFGDGTTSNEQNPRHTFPKVGSYVVKLQVMSSFGCSSTIYSREISVFAPFLEAGADKTIIRGGQTRFDIVADGNNLKYKWTPSAGLSRDDVKSPVATPNTETLYTVTVTSEEGCILTDNVRVSIVEDITIPNTFTPNGDGINDVWSIKYLESFPTASINVFTRYGVQVFTSKGYFMPWDGSWQGTTLMPGTYYYIISVPTKQKPYSGYVTIIR